MRSRDRLAVVLFLALVSAAVIPLHASAQITEILDSSGDGINSLNNPTTIAVDSAGNVYVGGESNVFKVTPSGTIAGIIDSTGDGAGNLLEEVTLVVVDANANVYVFARSTNNLFKITPSGTIMEMFDFGGAAELGSSDDMAIDASDNLFLLNVNSDKVHKISPSGTLTNIINATGDGAGNIFERPYSIALDSASNVYVNASASDNVFKITASGTITEILGDGVGNRVEGGLRVDSSSNVFVTSDTNTVFKISSVGTITEIIDYTGDGNGNGLLGLTGLAVDSASNVYVGGYNTDNFFQILPTGTIVEIIDSSGDLSGNTLDTPSGVVTFGSEVVYIIGRLSDNVFRIFVNQCNDGIDNDGDGFTDFPADVGCQNSYDQVEDPACSDGVDNDGDGLADFGIDPGCAAVWDASELNPAVGCDDGIDNDGDGFIDTDDPGCDDVLDLSENSPILPCDDGSDNDLNGIIDYPLDPGCLSPIDPIEDSPDCSDQGDNDSDGFIDFPLDPGCDDALDDSEKGPTLVCDDGIDNDSDGLTDFPFDPGCLDPSDPTELTVITGPFGPREWIGSLELKLGALPPLVLTGVGVATFSGPGFDATILNLAGGIAGTAAVPVTDPEVSQTVVTYSVSASLGSGQLAPFSMGQPLTQKIIPIPGVLRVCLATIGCGSYLPLNLTTNAGGTGVGVGGLVTIGWPGPVRYSMIAGHWTLGTATLTTQTASGGYATVQDSGFIHRLTSATATALSSSAELRLVAPSQIHTKGVYNSRKIALFTTLNIRFIPEPGVLLTLAAGAVALMLLGRSRRKD